MGDKEAADEALIADYSCNDADANHLAGGYLPMECDYRFGVDNIMDLSHINFIHRDSLARRLNGCEDTRSGVRQEDETVWSQRTFQNVPNQSEAEVAAKGIEQTYRNTWINVRWNAPANMLLMSGSAPVGEPAGDVRESRHTHIFTPATADTCHYWFGVARPKELWTREQVASELEMLRRPFAEEDHPMLIAQQQAFGTVGFWDARPIMLIGDAAAIRARRIMEKKIQQEAG
jgi:vanillate O-demethylase monooxygenase subunit